MVARYQLTGSLLRRLWESRGFEAVETIRAAAWFQNFLMRKQKGEVISATFQIQDSKPKHLTFGTDFRFQEFVPIAT